MERGEKALTLEHFCYGVLLEILTKAQSTRHFLFALRRKAQLHECEKSVNSGVVFFSCIASLLIIVLISQLMTEESYLLLLHLQLHAVESES